MAVLSDYCCPRCEEWQEHMHPMNSRPARIRCECGGRAEWRPSAPHINTAATFAREIFDADVQRSMKCDGSYIDPNLSMNEDGSMTPITSPGQRQRLMRERGLVEVEPSDKAKDVRRERLRGRRIYTGGSQANA